MNYLKFYRYLIPYWKKEALILCLSVSAVGLSAVNPYLTKIIIDQAYGERDLKLFIVLISVGALTFVLNGALSGLSNYLNRYIRVKVNFDLSRRFFKRLQNLPFSFFQNSSTGAHLYKISYDLEQAGRFIADTLPLAATLILRTLFILGLVFYLNWKMGLFALALVPFLYLLPLYFTKRLKKAYAIWIKDTQAIFKHLQEVLSHMHLVKAFGKERSAAGGYIRHLARNIRFILSNTRIEVAGSFANSLANRVILGLIIFYGGYQLIKGRMTLGDLSAISIYLSQLSGLQSQVAQFFQQVSLGEISCARIEKILEIHPEVPQERPAKIARICGSEIEFQKVTFGYAPERKILDNLSFSISAGSCVGLTGHSGCGKTTVISLLLRLYKLNMGRIFIGGNDIRDIESAAFYEQIGVALQEPFLWNDTIENNIKYARPNATPQEIQEAARVACIGDFVNGLLNGYKTVIGENACKISEGQKQRIAIARALIKRPKILILDEALSCVDMELEAKVIDNIKGFLGGSTLIMASHRPSVIERTERVYFLGNAGRMVSGTHEELLKNNLRYQGYLSSLPQEALSGAGKEIQ